ncbi:hypothetical protein GCM10009557_65510 [Virgisporangium ochraceum]|uniref:Uncharacterized protein n=1 Tax=Virgisporangium ochraceum TaxID=65505 RepID=A0A8J4A8G9_9ACTN|nr:hypothetical protein Voc01_102070 [Virgisporangium ochraceum]
MSKRIQPNRLPYTSFHEAWLRHRRVFTPRASELMSAPQETVEPSTQMCMAGCVSPAGSRDKRDEPARLCIGRTGPSSHTVAGCRTSVRPAGRPPPRAAVARAENLMMQARSGARRPVAPSGGIHDAPGGRLGSGLPLNPGLAGET